MEFDEKPKRKPQESDTSRNIPCVICNGVNYEWGRVAANQRLVFLPRGTWGGFGLGQRLEARKCLRCGNIQLFVSS